MAKITKIEKFLTALFDNGGELGRAQLAVLVFRRNWSAAKLDDLLASPELRGLVTINRATLRGHHAKGNRKRPRGRPSTRYCLTGSGWALLSSGLRHGVEPHRMNTEEVQRQFQLLLTDLDPWASAMTQDAARGRAAEVAEQRKHEEATAARRAALAAAKPRNPHHRSPNQLEARRVWFEGKMAEKNLARNAEGKFRPPQAAEQDIARAIEPRAEQTSALSDAASLWPPMPPIPPPITRTEPERNASALLARIARAGYRTSNGLVLFDGKWIGPQEWTRRMPGCLD